MCILRQVWNIWHQQLWTVLHQLCQWKASTAVQPGTDLFLPPFCRKNMRVNHFTPSLLPACFQTGARGIHEGGDPLDTDRLLWQPAMHQPHWGQAGCPWPSRRGVQGKTAIMLHYFPVEKSPPGSIWRKWVRPWLTDVSALPVSLDAQRLWRHMDTENVQLPPEAKCSVWQTQVIKHSFHHPPLCRQGETNLHVSFSSGCYVSMQIIHIFSSRAPREKKLKMFWLSLQNLTLSH